MVEDAKRGEFAYIIVHKLDRFSRNRTEAALSAKHLGGQPAYSYDVEKPTMKVLVNPQEADVVRLIYEKFLDGKRSVLARKGDAMRLFNPDLAPRTT
jgi:hypothetical protein